MSPPLVVHDLGRRAYQEVLDLQRELCRRRIAGEFGEDLLLLVEHEPVVTLGRGTKATSLPFPPDHLASLGYTVAEVERGGDVTYHGPGQLVGYPILDLQQLRPDLHWYLRQLEAALIAALAALEVPAERVPGLTGVWTEGRKIASIGIHVRQWITFHGFALNVVNDLNPFGLIVPCGISDVVMTSVAAERERRGRANHAERVWRDTREAVIGAMGELFEREPVSAAGSCL